MNAANAICHDENLESWDTVVVVDDEDEEELIDEDHAGEEFETELATSQEVNASITDQRTPRLTKLLTWPEL